MDDGVINVSEDNVDVSVSMESVTRPSAAEIKDKKLTQMDVLKMAVRSVTFSTAGIVGDLPAGFSQDPFHLMKAHAAVIFAIFIVGLLLLLLSCMLPRVPAAVGVANKLVSVAEALVYIAHGLKLTIHAIY